MAPLVPVLFPRAAPPPPGTLPSWVQPFNLVKLKARRQVARVISIDPSGPAGPMVKYQVLRERLKPSDPYVNPDSGPTGAPEKVSAHHISIDWTEYKKNPRNFYMGPTPGKDDPVGQAVQARMATERKLVNGMVRYGRDNLGNPLPPGQYTWHRVADCDMGHIIDAATWWNSNGRFTGPQSKEVQLFMEDPDNYELEPSDVNRLRGGLLGGRGGRYLPSAR
jgi:HNH/ENDO VII superfamily nuclease with conserved GHE residues